MEYGLWNMDYRIQITKYTNLSCQWQTGEALMDQGAG